MHLLGTAFFVFPFLFVVDAPAAFIALVLLAFIACDAPAAVIALVLLAFIACIAFMALMAEVASSVL